MISNNCLYHVVMVKDLECETPSIEVVPLLREFPKVFPNDLRVVSSEWEIDFGIYLLPETNLISIPPYWIILIYWKS